MGEALLAQTQVMLLSRFSILNRIVVGEANAEAHIEKAMTIFQYPQSDRGG